MAVTSWRAIVDLLPDLPDPQHDPERAREVADEILARSEYQWDDGRSLVDRVGEWIAEQLGRLLSPLGVGGGIPVWLGWLVLALLVAVVVFLVVRSRRGWRRDHRPGGRGGEPVVVTESDLHVDWAAAADRHEREGRWRDGLRCRYRALVGSLAQRDVLGDLAGRTSGELAREVAVVRPPAARPMAAATELFEEAWYGGEAMGPAERDRFVTLAGEVLAATEATVGAAAGATGAHAGTVR